MSKHVTFIAWDEVPHLSEDDKKQLAASYLPHERDARTKGIPSLGAGAIYPVPEEDVLVDPFEIPAWWKVAYGMDVGWNRTAVVWGAIDPENDVLYLFDEYYRGEAEPVIHAEAIKARGAWIPGAIDPASRGRSQHDGEQLLSLYTGLGLKLIIADNAVTSGIYEVWMRLSTGRLRVFRSLRNWLAEYRIYRRDEKGKIIKENDHLQDAGRYLVMSGLAIAAQRPFDDQMVRAGFSPQGKMEAEYSPFAEAYSLGAPASSPKRTTWRGIGGRE